MTNKVEINGVACLAARAVGHELHFCCDDCDYVLEFDTRNHEPNDEPVREWSITQRKQRCPDCTVKAREKGWVT